MKIILSIVSLASAMLSVMSIMIMVFGLMMNNYNIGATYGVLTVVWVFLTVITGYAGRSL